jgi:hypothetical protein
LAKKLVFAFGFDLPDIEGFEALSFASDRSWLDADVIAVAPTLENFNVDGEHDGRPVLSRASSFKYRELRQHWSNQISAALQAGKTVVFFLVGREHKFYYTGTRDVSGTGRNQKITHHVTPVSNYDFLPLKLGKPSYAKGRSMVLDSGADVLSAFWSQFGDRMQYSCAFELDKSRPLIRTKSGGHLVGALKRWDGGAFFLLPEINWDDIEELEKDEAGKKVRDDDGYYVWTDEILQFTRQLRDALLSIDSQVKKDREETPPPGWSETPEYRLAVEAVLEGDVLALGAQIQQLEAQRVQRRAELKAQGALRALLFEKGLSLEAAVRDALGSLGFDAHNFKQEGSEFDALFVSEEGRFLGEVEGKDNKAVNVDKISQLQRNITEDFSREEVDEMAVGVLFGNAYRLTPPVERAEFFTEKVCQVAALSKIALVV